MILTEINEARRYSAVTPLLGVAIDWLVEHRDDKFEKGEFPIGPDDAIIVKCEEPHLLPADKAALEAHRRFIDIHVPLRGIETIGWAAVPTLRYPHGEYDQERDVRFYGDSATAVLHVQVGQIAIFFPDDAHAPNIGTGTHKKLCIKIPVE